MLRELIYWLCWFVFTFGGGYAYWPRAAGQYGIGPHFFAAAMFFLIGITTFPIKF